MKKKVFIAILGVVLLVGSLAGVKALQINKMVAQAAQAKPPAAVVTAMAVARDSWETRLTAVGSLSAVQGVTVAAELPGKVVEIAFEPGNKVSAGTLLARQDTSAEQALLPGAEASLTLASTNLERAKNLLIDQAVSQSEVDTAQARYYQALADAENLKATIAKKQVRAPFSGRLGIRQINLGQILKEGDPIVTLQSLDPIFVDFQVPQQQMGALQPGLTLRVSSDGLPNQALEGRISTINPKVEETTRNVRVQGLVGNPKEQLRPGMYVDVDVVLPDRKEVLMIPQTAILYAPYGNSVFVVEPVGEGPEAGQVLRQQFVRTGEKRGDFVEVLSGVEAGELVVTTGVFKLRNKQAVIVDNALQPDFQLQPEPENK